MFHVKILPIGWLQYIHTYMRIDWSTGHLCHGYTTGRPPQPRRCIYLLITYVRVHRQSAVLGCMHMNYHTFPARPGPDSTSISTVSLHDRFPAQKTADHTHPHIIYSYLFVTTFVWVTWNLEHTTNTCAGGHTYTHAFYLWILYFSCILMKVSIHWHIVPASDQSMKGPNCHPTYTYSLDFMSRTFLFTDQ